MEAAKIEEIKLRVAETIINCNLVEKQIKEIISIYVQSSNPFFTDEILLNNLIISLGSKLKLLEYIINEEKISVDKSFMRSLKTMLFRRNIIAHSDSILDFHQIVDVDVDSGPDGIEYYPIYDEREPVAATIQGGSYKYENIEKICDSFDKYHSKVTTELDKILASLS